MLFSALFGTGCQLAVLVLVVILFAFAGPLHGDVYEERGEMVSTFIVCYALTSFVSGYVYGRGWAGGNAAYALSLGRGYCSIAAR